MEGLIHLLIALIFLLTGTQQQADDVEPILPGQMMEVPVLVEHVEPLLVATDGASARIRISGSIPDGCDYPVQIRKQRDGNTFTVEVFREVPMGVYCPQVIQPYTQMLVLSSPLEAGSYTIHVNDYTLEVVI